MNSDSLYRSLTRTRARSLSVFLKKIIASKMCEILCKKSNELLAKKNNEKIYLCVVHAFRASNPERIKTDEKRILFVPTITIDSVRSEALVLCSFLLTR